MGEVIYFYTRKQAIADGFQVDVSTIAKEAGIQFPVFLTRRLRDKYVSIPEGVPGQDEAGWLWDVVWMLRCAIAASSSGVSRLPFQLYVRDDNHKPYLVKLHGVCGALDIDDPQSTCLQFDPDTLKVYQIVPAFPDWRCTQTGFPTASISR